METAIVRRDIWIFLIAVLLSFLHFAKGQTCAPYDQCSCKFPNGTFITLWGIDQRYTISGSVPGASYLYRPCTGLIEPNSECNGAIGCQVGTKKTVIAFKPKYVDVSYNDVSQVYVFGYQGSFDTQFKISYKMQILLVCDSTKEASFSTMLGCEVGTCIVQLTSKCACAGGCSIPKPIPGQKSNRKLSTGSVLCIILLVLVVVYIAAGVAINKYALHKEGSDVIPQKAFWSDIPSLVKDGCIFTYEITFKRKSDYEKI